MNRNIKCISCGYLFGFSREGEDLLDKEFDPESLRQSDPSILEKAEPHDKATYRNFTKIKRDLIGNAWEEVGPYKWGEIDYVGCFRHQFENIPVAIRVKNEGGFFTEVFSADTSKIATVTHVDRDCKFFIAYQQGLSARKHEELDHKLVFERQLALVHQNEQFHQLFSRFFELVQKAETADAKKASLENLAELLFGSIDGLKVVDRDLRTSAEEVDCLVRNESNEPFWRNLGNPFIVECKNWGIPVGAKEIRDLRGKITSRNIKTAFLIAKNGITGNGYHDAKLEVRQALGNGINIIVLQKLDLEEIVNGLSPLDKLKHKYEDLFRI